MTILWGTSFPEFWLVRTVEDEQHQFTGDGSNREFNITLAGSPVLKETDLLSLYVEYTTGGSSAIEHATPGYKGQTSFSIVTSIDYNSGTIDLTLSNVPDNGTDIIVHVNYYYRQYNYTFTDIFLDDEDVYFKQEPEYQLTTFQGRVIVKKKWRLISVMKMSEYKAFTYSDQLRMIFSWDDKIVLFPRPSALNGYFVYTTDDFRFEHPENKWIGEIFSVKFASEKIYTVIPNNDGQDGSDIDKNHGDVIQ